MGVTVTLPTIVTRDPEDTSVKIASAKSHWEVYVSKEIRLLQILSVSTEGIVHALMAIMVSAVQAQERRV
jgi:hypothetical protein